MTHETWELRELEDMWRQRARLVELAKRGISPQGMTHPSRDPVEHDWLTKHGREGAFVEVTENSTTNYWRAHGK